MTQDGKIAETNIPVLSGRLIVRDRCPKCKAESPDTRKVQIGGCLASMYELHHCNRCGANWKVTMDKKGGKVEVEVLE